MILTILYILFILFATLALVVGFLGGCYIFFFALTEWLKLYKELKNYDSTRYKTE